jgi:hypothetical protein
MDSGTPYTVITGKDPEALGTFCDRGGRPRNGATGPPHRSVSLYASRHVGIGVLTFDVGASIDNLFNHRNVFEVGRVACTPWFGRALDAGAARTFEIWTAWRPRRE